MISVTLVLLLLGNLMRVKVSRPRRFPLGGKNSQYALDTRLGGPQNRSGREGEVNIFYPTGTRNSDLPGRPAHIQLYRLGSYSYV
jgi:hypothetical protein